MARPGRFLFRALLAAALSGGAYFAWVSWIGSPSPVDLLPAGALGVVEVRGAGQLAARLSGTRFASTFAKSATRELLERTETVQAFDAALSEFARIGAVSPGRGGAFDVLGAEAVVGWYPADGGGAVAVPWVAGTRLGVRPWVVATAIHIGRRFGLGSTSVAQERIAGTMLYSFPGGAGESLHVFLAGRVLVGGSDRALVAKAALAVGDPGAAVTREPVWRTILGTLPPGGELLVWVRDRSTILDARSAGLIGHGAIGARLRAGKTIAIDVAAEPASARPTKETAGGAVGPLPGIALVQRDPLFFLASRAPVPTALTDLLQSRLQTATRRNSGRSAPVPAIRPGSGYAVVLTDGVEGSGFFPLPRGLAVIGMTSAVEAARALPLLFPPGARSATGGGTRALASRESFPLAGEFELWGAAIGPQLVFATDIPLIGAAGAGIGDTRNPGDPSWPVGTVASVSMGKLLPLLRRWSAPLSGLVAANWPEAPDVARDLDLLGAVGIVRVAAGSDDRFDRMAITITVHDLR